MSLEAVLAAMSGARPPLLGEQAQPSAQAENTAAEQRSLVNAALHQCVGTVWRTPQSTTRDEVEKYLSEIVTAVPLFVGGRRGYVASAILFGLNEAKASDTMAHQLSDLGFGCLKGTATKYAFEKIGARKDFNFALKGMSMGASSRGLDVGLTRETWFDKNDSFQPLLGTEKTIVSAIHPASLATDVLTFGIAHGGIKGANWLSKGAVEASPRITNALTGSAFGFTSGSLGELQRQMNDPKETFDPLKIMARGGLSAASMTLSASAGYQLTAAARMQPVVRPQTEPFSLSNLARPITEQVARVRSWLSGNQAMPEPAAGSTAGATNKSPLNLSLMEGTRSANPAIPGSDGSSQPSSYLQELHLADARLAGSPEKSPVTTVQPKMFEAILPAEKINTGSGDDGKPWQRPIILNLRDLKQPIDLESLRLSLGQCHQTTQGNCKLLASLNTITTDLGKATVLANAVEQVGAKDYRVTLQSKWIIDDAGTRKPVTIDVNFDQAQATWNEFRTTGKISPNQGPLRGPLKAQLFEYALLQHMMQPYPPELLRLLPNGRREGKPAEYRGYPTRALSDAWNAAPYLGGKLFCEYGGSDMGFSGLDNLAPGIHRLSVTAETRGGPAVTDVNGDPLTLTYRHRYSILNINPDRQAVTILNPHRNSKPVALPYQTFLDSFVELDAYQFSQLDGQSSQRQGR